MIHLSYFVRELANNPELYVDKSTNTVNLTTLAECYINDYNVQPKMEEEVFEGVVDWFENWSGRNKYNN